MRVECNHQALAVSQCLGYVLWPVALPLCGLLGLPARMMCAAWEIRVLHCCVLCAQRPWAG